MEVIKGVHIILKRDKLSYDTNVLGKWENYPANVYEGTVLRDAVARFKPLLKAGKPMEDELASLKAMLKKSAVIDKTKEADFWSIPKPEEKPVEVPPAEKTAIDLLREHLYKFDPVKEIPKDKVDFGEDDGKRYVVTAYVNKKTDKQMYLASWDDSNDWMISAAPYATTKSRCEFLINKAQVQIDKAREASTIRSRFPDNLKFEIVEVQ